MTSPGPFRPITEWDIVAGFNAEDLVARVGFDPETAMKLARLGYRIGVTAEELGIEPVIDLVAVETRQQGFLQ